MKKFWSTILLLLAFHLFLLLNLRFTAWPEMLSYPYLRNQGFLLYKDMIHPYPPILTMALSFVYKLFGYRLEVLQIISWIPSLFSGLLVYLITKCLTKKEWSGLVALALYIFLQPFLEGNMLWFDNVVVAPLLLGAYFGFRWTERKGESLWNLLLAGLFFGIAGFIKQTMGVFLLLFLLFVWLNKGRVRETFYLIAFPVVIAGVLLIRLLQEGALQDFLNWTIIYPATEWRKFPNYVQMSLTNQQAIVLLLLFLPALFLLLFRRLYKDKIACLLLFFLIGGGLAVYPRFSFFHLQPTLALLVIFYGYSTAEFKKFTTPLFLVIVFYAAFLIWFIHLPVLRSDWRKEARFWGVQEQLLAQVVRETVAQKEKVFLLGVHSEIYALSDRQPPKRWTDNFGWYLEIPGVQEEVLSRWEQNPPMYIFWRTPATGNWFNLGTYQPKKIVEYIKTNYNFDREVVPEIQIWKRKS